ncbi:GMC oxidoreductase [Pseudoxanthomonas helianthi]|uniref:GMC oxidoreductase n=1 Tax=Pseudoxanthomonas helianthi TaxID=1453541 RepID=UPI001FD44E1C|nr:GMC oxidoreductase [Pseudoxanthomonas helianthi]
MGGDVIVDFRDRSSTTDIEVDLCIIGAGPAGITIARGFLGGATSVCLVESGGIDAENRVQELNSAASIGPLRFDARNSRLRAFGGSSEVWGGGCIPLSNIDFETRDWVPHSGWPLSYEQLLPYYERAKTLFHVQEYGFVEGSFLGDVPRPPPVFDESLLVNRKFVSNAVRFGTEYLDELRRAENIRVLLHASLVAFDASPDARAVSQARIASLDGRKGVVRAKQYVLACGGIENARLLLLSDSAGGGGLGNAHDVVGRYFMDHPSGRIGKIHASDPEIVTRPYDRSAAKGTGWVIPELCVSDAGQRSMRLLNARARPVAVEGDVPKGLQALRRLRQGLRRPTRGERQAAVLESAMDDGSAARDGIVQRSRAADATLLGLAGQATKVALGAGDIAQAWARKLADKPAVAATAADIDGYFEQAPNPDSRIVLGDELDALGQRKAQVDWRLTPLDWHTYRVSARIFGAELARTCSGRFELAPWLQEGDDATPPLHGTSHHLGTTRMDPDPRKGVVDLHSRVHGVDNLYVAGSSVFPTGGWAFPTFTIVAMSLRLVEYLQALL